MVSTCPVCRVEAAPTRLSVVTDRRYHVDRCGSCGLAFTVPRPTALALAAFYGEQYFKRTQSDLPFGYVDYEGESWAAINADRTWDDLGEWGRETRGVPLKRLLDVGAATGDFGARALGDGWDVVAFELGDSARARAAEKGLATVTSLDEAQGSFGLITMFHVLEHLIDPLNALVQTRSLIDSKGLLAIEIPQWRSAGRIARRSRWAQLRPPEHINFFSKRSLAYALESAGWAVVRNSTPYPKAALLALDAAKKRKPRQACVHAARLVVGRAGFGGYLRAIARPA